MLNLGTGELVVIFLVALIVLGPTKLPDAARQMGRVAAELRRLSTGFQDEMRAALQEPPPALQEPPPTLPPLPPAEPAADAQAASTSPASPRRRAPLQASSRVSAEQQLSE